MEYVYFIERGLISVVVRGPDREGTAVGVVGPEGCNGHAALASGRTVFEMVVQVEGQASRIALPKLNAAMGKSPALVKLLQQSIQVYAMQVAFTSLANARAPMDKRLARWLLMVQDRVGGNDIALTHNAISEMLGVRRSSVTDALTDLQQKGLLRKRVGGVVIDDRAAMEALADRFYGEPEKEQLRIFGP